MSAGRYVYCGDKPPRAAAHGDKTIFWMQIADAHLNAQVLQEATSSQSQSNAVVLAAFVPKQPGGGRGLPRLGRHPQQALHLRSQVLTRKPESISFCIPDAVNDLCTATTKRTMAATITTD